VSIAVSGEPIFRERGEFCGYRGVSKNVTARKKAEQALRAAKDAAEAGNRAKSQFLATMSHEIRTPMHGVLRLLEILLGGELAPEQRQYAATAYSSAETLL
jgi:signal transduction histidine kinase